MKKKLKDIANWKNFNPYAYKRLLKAKGIKLNPKQVYEYKDVLNMYRTVFKEYLRAGLPVTKFVEEHGYLLKPGGFVEGDFFPSAKYLEDLANETTLAEKGLIDITGVRHQDSRAFYEELMTPQNPGARSRKITGEMADLGVRPFKDNLKAIEVLKQDIDDIGDRKVDFVTGILEGKRKQVHHVTGIMEAAPFFEELSDDDAFKLRQILFRDGYMVGSVAENRLNLENLVHLNKYPDEILDYFKSVDPEGFKEGLYAGTGIHEIMGEMRITDKQGGSLFSDDLKTLLKTKDVDQRAKLFEEWFDYTIEGKQAAFMEAYTHPRNLPGGKETPKALAELKEYLKQGNMDEATRWMKNRGFLTSVADRQAKLQKGRNIVGLSSQQSDIREATRIARQIKGMNLDGTVTLNAGVGDLGARTFDDVMEFAGETAKSTWKMGHAGREANWKALNTLTDASSPLIRKVGSLVPVVGAGMDVVDFNVRQGEMAEKMTSKAGYQGSYEHRMDQLQLGLSGGTVATTWWAEPANVVMGIGNLGLDVVRTATEEEKRKEALEVARQLGTGVDNVYKAVSGFF